MLSARPPRRLPPDIRDIIKYICSLYAVEIQIIFCRGGAVRGTRIISACDFFRYEYIRM